MQKELIDLMKEKRLKLKQRSKRYPKENIKDTDYSNDHLLLANTSAQAESRQHIQEQAARSSGLYVK